MRITQHGITTWCSNHMIDMNTRAGLVTVARERSCGQALAAGCLTSSTSQEAHRRSRSGCLQVSGGVQCTHLCLQQLMLQVAAKTCRDTGGRRRQRRIVFACAQSLVCATPAAGHKGCVLLCASALPDRSHVLRCIQHVFFSGAAGHTGIKTSSPNTSNYHC